MTDIIPVLTADRPLLVNAAGERVSGRPRPGTFAARKPQPYNYGGPMISAVDYMMLTRRRGPNCSVSKMMKKWERTNQEGRQRLDRAIFDLSQENIGIERLRAAKEAGTVFVFDDHKLRLKDANATANSEDLSISLCLNDSHADLCFDVLHELDHIHQFTNGLRPSYTHGIKAALRLDYGMEASSRTIEGVCAYQAKFSDAHLPGIYRPQGLIDAYTAQYSAMGLVAIENETLAWAEDWPGFAQKLFESYQYEVESRDADCENTIYIFSEGLEKDPLPEDFMTQDVTGDTIARALTINGQSYADANFLDQDLIVTFGKRPSLRFAYAELREKLDSLNKARGNKMQLDVPMAEEGGVEEDLKPLEPSVVNHTAFSQLSELSLARRVTVFLGPA